MKQHLNFKMSLPDSSFSLYLRKIYEESKGLIVILEVENRGKGAAMCAVQNMSLDLMVEVNSTKTLPVTYFVIHDMKKEMEQPKKKQRIESPWWLKNVNHVLSDESIARSERATCLFNGELKVGVANEYYTPGVSDDRWTKTVEVETYHIENGCGDMKKTIIETQEHLCQSLPSNQGFFAAPRAPESNEKNSNAPRVNAS